MIVCDGMFLMSYYIGYFGSVMNVFLVIFWLVLFLGKDFWVNVNMCGFNYVFIICYFFFKVVKVNESKLLMIVFCLNG